MISQLNLISTLYSLLRHPYVKREEIVSFQNKRLHRLIAHAYENVPYYRKLFNRNGIKPKDIQSVADLSLIPITSKKDLQSLPAEEVVARGVNPKSLIALRTSGSSGEPFTIRRAWLEARFRALFRLRAMHYLGQRPTDRIASLGLVRPTHPNDNQLPMQIFQAIGLYRRLRIDSLLPPEDILHKLRCFHPDILSGSPGVLSRLAQIVSDEERPLIRPRFVKVSGEVVTPLMRRQITEAFNATVFDVYSGHEFGMIAWECKETGELHTCDDKIIVEVLNDGRPAATGERGEVVGTNLYHFAMPFIRYRLGDIVTKGFETCRCGQPFSTIRSIQGRMLDYFPLPGGRVIHPYEISFKLFLDASWIRQYQMVQEREDRIILRLVPSTPPTPQELAQLEESVSAILGQEVEFQLILVPEIQLEQSGKFRVSRSLVKSAYDGIHWDLQQSTNSYTLSRHNDEPLENQKRNNMSVVYQTEFDRDIGITTITEILGGSDVTQIFVHSVTSLENIAEIAPTAPVYPERSLLFARSDDIVCVSKKVDEDYLRFLHSFGIGPRNENIIVASEDPQQNCLMSLSELLMNNQKALLTIKRLLKADKKIFLNPFISTPIEFKLAASLETVLGKKVHLLGNPNVVDYANHKHNVKIKAIELGVPVSEGDIIELDLEKDGKPLDLTPIRVAINKYIHKTGKVIIRGSYGASGSSLFIVENKPQSIEKALRDIADRTSNRIYLVEVMLKLIASPNIMMHIEPGDGRILCISVTDQILSDNLMHEGIVYPSSAKTLKEMIDSTRIMSKWLQSEGYGGLVGFHFAEYLDPKTGKFEHFLAEVNPRVNAAVYPKSVIECLNRKQGQKGKPYIEAFLSAKIKTRARSFAELNKSYGHLFFKPETGKGLVPYNIGWMEHGKFNLAVFGKSRDEVVKMYEDFKALLAKE